MSRIQTQQKILDAAESLFAETGFNDTSLRQITSRAEVNLAAVNYHFGSKKALIQAVLQRYLKVVMPRLEHQFEVLLARQKPTQLPEVLAVFVQPLLELEQIKRQGTTLFLQLLGRGYTDVQGHLRKFISHHYGSVLNKFVLLVQQSCPGLDAAEIFWRLHFSLGTVVFTMASSEALFDIAAADYHQQADIESVIRRLLPYLAAGIAAPVIYPEQLNSMAQAAS
ncbi:TetR/AcrR family transcriptional regulator [Alkalimonas sp.]|uniref:TetR/AcrR family transcriptional regulator n=1 Tax=Alkalimonas sp. TaxID=1872453 RepID=UPI00263B86D9|nr:TetR/AcrR family transcriptional regulator [Alkalimonas sp.]MCC5824819.1 TetR family transcriptional regulator [Alkalimonas sp.]